MTAGELIVHEARTLDGGGVGDDEPFLRDGPGSAFVSRPGEVVWLRTSAAGLGLLPGKVKRLVDKGLHGVLVSLQGVSSVPDPRAALASLLQAARHVEQFAGWLRVVEAPAALVQTLSALPGGDGVVFLTDREAALADYRRHLAQAAAEGDDEDPLQGMRSDELPIRPREVLPQPSPDDWGWSGADLDPQTETSKLPPVEVAELFVEEGELRGLLEQVKTELARGRRYLTLRVHFKRGAQRGGEELAALVEARELLARNGGQLVLAGLQAGFEEWLRSTGGFQIAEGADQAERLHRLHAARRLAADSTAGAVETAPFVIVTQSRDRLLIRPRELRDQEGLPRTTRPLRLLRATRESLGGLGRRLRTLPREGIEAAVVDLSAIPTVDGLRAEPLLEAALGAVAGAIDLRLCDVSPELRAWLRLHGLDEALLHDSLERAALDLAAALRAREPFQELSLELSREDLGSGAREESEPGGPVHFSFPVASRTPPPLVRPAPPATGEDPALRQRLATAELERGKLEESLRREERRQIEAEQGLARAERRLAEHERAATVARAEAQALRDQLQSMQRERDEARAAADARAQRLGELEAQLAELPELRHRVAQLERDKARILTEAEQEIERLGREQEALREELESAGEMIERLGKELEHS